ncbi:Zinc finger protein ZAT9 [Cardamine amara subsp. amara]|uniref:Zinc finger protein ZAT9 n=1 Tax=Cardamine amara subsp. amara TaxID=228776 RepID=A0ABD0ZVB8_CARAN
MEQYKERKFVCKYCSKRFPCGKSLGGHIRTHMNENSLDSDEDESNKLKIDENGGQSSYGLRENPKKNKRFVDHRQMMALKQQQQQQQLLYCRECGKGFVSSKALCGHMACHSEREKIVMDSQSDTEASSSPIRRRSKRALVKHHHHNKAGFVVDGGIMDQFNSTSSDASEIEPEQEEMALSLMMLSRDSSFKKGHSHSESSDNNSVILETKSSTGEQLKMKNVEDLCKENNLGVDIIYDSDNSDSGYFRNGPKKLDSDVSVDGFFKNKSVMGFGSGFNSSLTKQDKSLNRYGGSGSGSGSKSGSGRSSTKYDLRKSKRSFPCYGRKKIKYELTESVYDSGEHSLETDSCADTNRSIKIHSNNKAPSPPMVKKANGAKKKSKGHECPICFRVFKSGQALGGHKRSHFIGNQEHRTLVIQHQVAHEMHTLIDLNLPAPIDE